MNQQHQHDSITIDRIRQLPLFAGLADGDLDTLYHMTRTITVAAGDVLIRQGDPPEAAYVIVDGELEVTARRGEQEVLIAVRRDGELVGEMSLLEQAPRSASVRATRRSSLLEVTQTALETLIGCSRPARWAILGGVASRLRSTQSLLEQNAKLAQLGKLAADLAHEINNPAAAVRRTVTQLREALETRDRLTAQLLEVPLAPAQLAAVEQLPRAAASHTSQAPILDTLARADREDELLNWLEERGIGRAWQIAEVLASYAWTPTELWELADAFDAQRASLVVELAAASTQVSALLDEIGRSAEAITERVKAVKEYAFLDQAPVQLVDVHHGLETTLTLLRHKISAGIAIRRVYAPDLPRIEAYGGELNQVWTNLIDNAVHAMGEQGELVLRTAREDGTIRVEIADSGPGIPADIVSRIFEVGFTTKAPGQGSGRGLHIARSIVEDKHRGRISLTSRPGETRFEISLPIELPRHATATVR